MDSKDVIVKGAEQIASLQELHKTIQVITIRGWVALLFVLVFSFAAVCWAFVGKLPVAVDGKCILIEEAPKQYAIYGFLPLFSGQQVKAGMQVNIALDSVDASRYGKIEGIVREVITYPVSAGDPILDKIPSASLRHYFTEGDLPTIMIVIEPTLDSTAKTGLKWTSVHSPSGPIPNASVGEAQIILRTIRPISYVIPEI